MRPTRSDVERFLQNRFREGSMKLKTPTAALVAIGMLCAVSAVAQDYPTKPTKIVVGFAAGSVSDLTARIIGQQLGKALGQPFIVEVRPGAGANVATQSVVRSPKDGYTLLVATSSSTIPSPQSANFGFDFGTDLAPIALISRVPFVLTVYPGLGVKNLKEFIALAKAKPELVTFGGTAVGTTGHLAAQLFNQRAGTNLVIAPYPSTAQATTDLMTGRISVAFATASNVLPLIETGKLQALAVAQGQRSELIPNVPSMDEAGLTGVDSSIWIGMLAPTGTPRDIIGRLNQAVNEALKSEEVLKQMRAAGMEGLGGNSEEFESRIKEDMARWDSVLKASGLVK
jgi:tripartite-type tricarboxylate transporter receptor subunit TctC